MNDPADESTSIDRGASVDPALEAVNRTRLDRVLNAFEISRETFLLLETEQGIDRNVVDSWQATDRLEAWYREHPYAEIQRSDGSIGDHLAASPTRWSITIGFAIVLFVFVIVFVGDQWFDWLPRSPSPSLALYLEPARDGYLFGFLLACGTVAFMTTRRVDRLTLRDSRPDRFIRVYCAYGYGAKANRWSRFQAAKTSDDQARGDFLRHHPIPTNAGFVRLGERWIRLADVAEVVVKARPTGLYVLAIMVLAALACFAILEYVFPLFDWLHRIDHFWFGLLSVVLAAVYLVVLFGLWITVFLCWWNIASGSWIDEGSGIVVRTTRGKSRLLGACDPLHARIIAADVATIIDNARSGGRA